MFTLHHSSHQQYSLLTELVWMHTLRHNIFHWTNPQSLPTANTISTSTGWYQYLSTNSN